MKSLTRTLEATGRAHVMVQGGVKADASTMSTLAADMMEKQKKKAKNSSSGSASKKK